MANTNSLFWDNPTASTFNILAVAHLGFAVFTSIFDADVSAAIAVMGIVAVLSANVPLLLLYLVFSPASILVDIIRMSIAPLEHKGAFGFFVFLKILEWLAKGGAVFFGYKVYSAASTAGPDGAGGYEQINSMTQSQQAPSYQPDPFNPSTYTAPPPPPAPVETAMKPAQGM